MYLREFKSKGSLNYCEKENNCYQAKNKYYIPPYNEMTYRDKVGRNLYERTQEPPRQNGYLPYVPRPYHEISYKDKACRNLYERSLENLEK